MNGWFLNGLILNRIPDSQTVWYSDGLNCGLFLSSIGMVSAGQMSSDQMACLIIKWLIFHKKSQKNVVCGMIIPFDSRNISSNEVNCQMSPVGCGTTTKRP